MTGFWRWRGWGVFSSSNGILLFSYSKITFEPGIPGPKGLKGRVGPTGPDSNIAECTPKNENLGNAKMFIKRENKSKEFIRPHLKS